MRMFACMLLVFKSVSHENKNINKNTNKSSWMLKKQLWSACVTVVVKMTAFTKNL